MNRTRREPGMLSNPILIGALTVLATIVAVTLAYQANNGLPFVPKYTLYLQMRNASEVTRNAEVHMGGALVGTDAVIGIVVNLVKAIMFGRLELLDHSLVLAGLLVGLCMVPGAYAARWLIDRMAMRIHTAIVESLVAFSGLSFLWSALT